MGSFHFYAVFSEKLVRPLQWPDQFRVTEARRLKHLRMKLPILHPHRIHRIQIATFIQTGILQKRNLKRSFDLPAFGDYCLNNFITCFFPPTFNSSK
jgi:hypothetical protein